VTKLASQATLGYNERRNIVVPGRCLRHPQAAEKKGTLLMPSSIPPHDQKMKQDFTLETEDIMRYESCIDKQEDGCWIWHGPVSVGKVAFNFSNGRHKMAVSARTLSFMFAYGKLPETMIHVTCENFLCINPDHMYVRGRRKYKGFDHIEPRCSCTGKKCARCKRVLCIMMFGSNVPVFDKRACHCKDCTLAFRMEHKYNLSPEEYQALFIQHDYQCAICGKQSGDGSRTKLYVDHDHKTGQVRALLCNWCNSHLGFVENKSWMEPFEAYLRKFEKPLAEIAPTLEG